MKPKYATSPSVLVAVSFCFPSCTVPGRASRRPLTPNQHDTAQVLLFMIQFVSMMHDTFPHACMHLFYAARTDSERRRMCLGSCRLRMTAKDSPFTHLALVMRQPVSMALHAALAQRRKSL